MNTRAKDNNHVKVFGVFASWNIEFYHNVPYIADMHYAYIENLCAKYEKVVVVSSSKDVDEKPVFVDLSKHDNLVIERLPFFPSYISAIKHIKGIIKVLSQVIPMVDVMYSRVPDPFCWCPSLLFRKPVIMDFIGDTIDATWHNEKWNRLKKILMITGYFPEYFLTLLAARKSAKVVTAGYKLSSKLSKYGIKAEPLIPSLLSSSDIPSKLRVIRHAPPLKMVYVGYIRYAKGIHTLMTICRLLKSQGIYYELNVIGVGEMLEEFKDFVRDNKLEEVHLLGFVEKREEVNNILYNSDLFLFPSLSEGAPRVVIEAMAYGVPVISTPVGSLPYIFKDSETIRYFDYNDAESAVRIIRDYIQDPQSFINQRDQAYLVVKNNFTKEKFFEQVFEL